MATEEGQVIECHSAEEVEQHLQKALESKKLVVIDFTASWCGPCRFIAPVLAEIAKKTPHVVFLKVDVDELEIFSKKFKVEAMPTFVFLKEGGKFTGLWVQRRKSYRLKLPNMEPLLLQVFDLDEACPNWHQQ